jgi:Tfp pilus assembly protein PilX
MRREDDRGFVLIYVMLITTIISILVATVTVESAANVRPAKQSANAQSALAAAEAGIQAYYASLLAATNCASLTMLAANTGACAGLGPGSAAHTANLTSADTTNAFTGGNQASYTYQVEAANGSFVRVKSTGSIGTNSSSPFYASRTLVADITGGSTRNFLDYAYYSTYETIPSALVQSEFGPRTIAFDSPTTLAAAGADSGLTKVTWGGVPTTGATGSQWCDALYYTPATAASTVNASTGGNGRAYQNSGLPTGYDWQEPATSWAGGTVSDPTHNGFCQVAFTTGTEVTGPLYTRDAYLLSLGYPGGSGPKFDAPAYSSWSTNDSPAASAPYNTSPFVGGDTSGGLNRPQTANFTLVLPSGVSSSLSSNTATLVCQYYGPTRVFVKAGFAYVTSPMTAASTSSACTTSGDASVIAPNVPARLTGAGTPSVVEAKVPVANTLIYVHQAPLTSSSAWAPGTPIFTVTGTAASGSMVGTPTVTTSTSTADAGVASNGSLITSLTTLLGQNPAPKADGAWNLWWTYYCSIPLTCDAAPLGSGNANLNQYNFEQDLGKTYPQFKAQLEASTNLTGSTGGTSLLGDMQSALVSTFSTDGITGTMTKNKVFTLAQSALPTPTATGQVGYYTVASPTSDPAYATASGCTTGTPTTPATDASITAPALADGDTVLGQAAYGTSYSETDCLQKQVKLTVYRVLSKCTAGVLTCTAWGWDTANAKPQFDFTSTRKQFTTAKYVGAPGSAAFPLSKDVTRYQTYQDGPGDAYVEGDITGKLSLVAEHDVVVTGNLTYDTPGTDAVDLVAANSVRLYHPVRCADAAATVTTAGYCPNDTTGLSPKGKLEFTSANFASHPSRQYTNLRRTTLADGTAQDGTDLASLTVSAAVFALGGAFLTDNYDRGAGYNADGTLATGGLKSMTLVGGVYQLHHGPMGTSWEIQSSATTRPTSGYAFNVTWDKTLSTRGLPYVPSPSGTNSTGSWTIVSTSAGG